MRLVAALLLWLAALPAGAGDTLYLDQDFDQGGLPYVREHRAQGPHAHPLQGVRWLAPCG